MTEQIAENGRDYVAVRHELFGTGLYTVFVKIYKHQPKIEVMVRIHKESLGGTYP